MPDDIQRTIYKLELDDSGYIRGVESMSLSTQKLVQAQRDANNTLRQSESALKAATLTLENAQKALNSYTGTDLKYRQQLEDALKDAQTQQQKLTADVQTNKKAYDEATKAALDYSKAVERIPEGGKLTPPPVLPPIAVPKLDLTDLTGLPGALVQLKPEMDNISAAIEAARDRMAELNETDAEFSQLSVFVNQAQLALEKYNEAVKIASESTVELGQRIEHASETLTTIRASSIEELPIAIARARSEFEQLNAAVTLNEERLKQMKPEDTGFDELAKEVARGRSEIEQYQKVITGAGAATGTFRTQMVAGQQALAAMVLAGKEGTQEFKDMQIHVAHLTELYHVQQQELRVLSSQTKALDFGKSAVRGAIVGFEAFSAVTILAGGASEKLQKKTMELFAAMQLLVALEELERTVKKGSTIQTLALSAAHSVYTAVVGASTGALKAFRIALLGTGIGVAIAAIAFLITKYIQHQQAVKKAREEQKLFNDINAEAGREAAKDVVTLNRYRDIITDISKSQQVRVTALNEYNKVADQTNQIDAKQINNLDLINKKIDAQIKLIIQRTASTAALGKITEAQSKAIDAQLLLEEKLRDIGLTEEQVLNIRNKAQQDLSDNLNKSRVGLDNYRRSLPPLIAEQEKGSKAVRSFTNDQILSLISLIRQRDEAVNAVEDIANRLRGLIVDVPTPKPEPGKEREIENVFIQERDRLLSQLTAIRVSEEEGIKKINDEFAQKLDEEQTRIAQLLKEKKLTEEQAKILVTLAVQVNQAGLEKAVADFRKTIVDAMAKLNAELVSLQLKSTQNTLELIQDEFDRRAKLIDFNEKKELDNLKAAQEERLRQLQSTRALVGEEDFQRARQVIISAGEQEVNNIIVRYGRQRQELAADIFKQTLKQYEDIIFQTELSINHQASLAIQVASQRFLSGIIPFREFQKQLNEIRQQADSENQRQTTANQQAELFSIDHHLATMRDHTTSSYTELKKKRDELQKQIDAANAASAQKDAETTAAKTEQRIKDIEDYTNAIGQLAQSVISFWQEANEAEQRALDRSITLQQERVDAAQKIADRGNAEYLRMESDRLKELTIQRENAARRELGINAAIQASQILVGITGAISEIASGVGTAKAIADIAVIIGALATGYGLIRSLQANQPKLKEGTPYLRREKGEPYGIDTIPVMASEGEAVIPAVINKEYHPVVQAIYNRTIPAEKINTFVNTYHEKKFIPQPDFKKIKETTQLKISQDAITSTEQNKLLMENNDLQRQLLRAMKNMSVSASIDKNGVAIMVNEWIEQTKIARKT